MKALVLDTSGKTQAMVLLEGSQVRAAEEWSRQPGAEPPLLARLRSLMERWGWDVNELDLVAVGRGPGSFTGLRVGLSLAAGIAYGRGIPLYVFDSLEALARQATGVIATACLRDAGRGEVYAWRPGQPAERISCKALSSWLRSDDRVLVEPAGALSGWSPEQTGLEIPLDARRPLSEALAASANQEFMRQEPVRYHDLQPLYAQPAAAQERLGSP